MRTFLPVAWRNNPTFASDRTFGILCRTRSSHSRSMHTTILAFHLRLETAETSETPSVHACEARLLSRQVSWRIHFLRHRRPYSWLEWWSHQQLLCGLLLLCDAAPLCPTLLRAACRRFCNSVSLLHLWLCSVRIPTWKRFPIVAESGR